MPQIFEMWERSYIQKTLLLLTNFFLYLKTEFKHPIDIKIKTSNKN